MVLFYVHKLYITINNWQIGQRNAVSFQEDMNVTNLVTYWNTEMHSQTIKGSVLVQCVQMNNIVTEQGPTADAHRSQN